MKGKLANTLALGAFLVILFGFFNMGLGFRMGLVTLNLDRLIAFWCFMGMICATLAYKKNKDPGAGFLVGALLGPVGIIYYLFCKKGMSEKEREVYEWELEKKHKAMLAERGEGAKSLSSKAQKESPQG